MVNTASIAGKHGQGWLAAYSATKFGVVGLSQALHKELAERRHPGDRALPRLRGHADDRLGRGQVPKDEMIQPEDIAEAVRFLLRTSRNCVVPEVQFVRPGRFRALIVVELAPTRALVLVEAPERTQPGPAWRRSSPAASRAHRRDERAGSSSERDARLEHRAERVQLALAWPAAAAPRAPV